MLILTGTVLVLLTWAVCLLGLMILGLPLAALTRRGPLGLADLRRGLWWGLLLIIVVVYLGNLVWPAASGAMAFAVVAIVLCAGCVAIALVRHRGWLARGRVQVWTVVLWLALAAAVGYLAVAALGPVTNYDSGLYHLGAIRYAADFATIPGLANLYFPFGYGNAEFPLAALLGNGPWGAEGFRLLNGLVIAGLCGDLAIRTAGRLLGPGFYVLAAGTTAVLIPMVALSDYWVTSPSQDSAVFAVTVAASAYVVDAVRGGRTWVADSGAAMALTVVLVMLRPTMAAYAVAVVAVVVLLRVRRGRASSPWFTRSAVLVGVAGLAAGAAATSRDYVLSGWLQYPLSVHPFDVPWRAPDPAPERIATLGFHRDPTNLYEAADGWGWVGPWLERLPQQWETYAFVGLAVVTGVGLVLVVRSGRPLRWRAVLLSTAPSIVMSVAWFVATPPSFRFAWGPVFTVLTVPLGWAAWQVVHTRSGRDRSRALMLVAVLIAGPVLLVTLYSAAMRLDTTAMTERREWTFGASIPFAVADVPEVETSDMRLASGLVVRVPTSGEQCWADFPLCTPRLPPTVSYRLPDEGLSGGLLP
jgi:hypothetical protein